MKLAYAWSSSARWVDTFGVNQTMGDKAAVMRFAGENGWELITVAEGTLYFKKVLDVNVADELSE